MKPDNIEEKLQRQPLKEIPAEWRGEILVAADVNRRSRPVREFTFAATTLRRLLSTLNAQLSTLLWPHPRAWAGLAAVWILILAVNFSMRDPSPVMAERFRAAIAGSRGGIAATAANAGGIDRPA